MRGEWLADRAEFDRVLERMQSAGPAESHLDLVADHRHTVTTAQFVQPRQEAVRRYHQAAVGKDRFDDQAGDRPGGQILLGEIQAGLDVGVDVIAARPERVGIRQE